MPILIRSLGLLVLISTAVLADDASDKALALNKEGTRLAEQGQFASAIERFKAAEALLPRYQHHCNIGIAYQDSGKLPQALLFLQSCVARAGKNASPASKARLSALETKLKAAPWGSLTVTGEQLRVAIAPWADEEWVVDGQRTFVLDPGPVSLLARGRDGSTWTQTATVTSGSVTSVSLTLPIAPPIPPADVTKKPDQPTDEPVVATKLSPTPPVTRPDPPRTTPAPTARPITPWVIAGAGAGLLVLGTVTYVVASGQRSTFPSTTPESELTGYRALIVTTWAGWGLGAAALVGGLLWGFLSGAPAPVAVMPSVGPRGEVVLSLSTSL